MTGFRVTFDDAGSTAFVAGPKHEARRRLAVCGDPSPIWVRRREAWATSVPAASRLLDQLEGRNVVVPIEDARQWELDLSELGPANVPLAQGGLW